MKKLVISLMIIIGTIVIGLSFKDITIQDTYATNDRFIRVLNEGQYEIICDKKTKVLYLRAGIYKGGGITVLLDKDGKPLLYGEE